MKWPLFLVMPRLVRILSWFAPIDIEAITLGWVVLSRRPLSEAVQRHERIHYLQYRELLFVFFLFVYLWDYCRAWKRYGCRKYAYHRIRLEQEAYTYMYEEGYCLRRQGFAWFRNHSV